MRRRLLISLLGCLAVLAQYSPQPALAAGTVINGSRSILGDWDAGSANSVKPMKQGVSASLPATCTVGMFYFKTDATAGQNVYACTATNTWTLEGGGSGSAYATVQDEGSSLTQRATINFTGAGVTCVDNSGSSRTDCTIPGSAGSITTREVDTAPTVAPTTTLEFDQSKGLKLTDQTGGVARAEIDGATIPYAPLVAANWNGGTDPGNSNDGLDQLAANLNPMLPASSPALSHDSYASSAGVSGINTWNGANTISGYANAPADSSINAGDALDQTVGTSGTGKGVYDWDTIVSVTGTLADTTAASGACPTYPAQSFGPGGTDGGATNDLKLVVNGSTKQTANLLTFTTGSSLNGNGSGFTSITAATAVLFPDCTTSFSPRKYRKGNWILVKADMSKGWNVVKIQEVTGSGTVTTNVWEFLLDDDNTATTITSESLTSLTKPNTKTLSGVTYSITPVTATYAATVNNQYRNTYVSGSGITDASTNCTLGNFPKTLAASAGNEAKTTSISETATLTGTRLLNGSMTGKVTTARTVQGSVTSTGAAISGILYDNASNSSGNLICSFDDETKRFKAGDDFATNLSADWDTTASLVGASADHNTGAQSYNGTLVYPTINFSTITNAPAGNPNYSGATGTRYYYGYFTTTSPTASNFRITLNGTATLISETATLTTSSVRLSLRLPSQTGWMDTMVAFVEGNFSASCTSGTCTPTHGCYSAGLGSTQTIPTTNLGVSFGTKSTASSFDKVFYRITVPQGWTGNLTDISIIWNAS